MKETEKISKNSGGSIKKIYDVEIAGIPLKLRTANGEEKVSELVGLVDKEVRAALHASQSGSLQNAALVAALNIAEEMLRSKDGTRQELAKLRLQAEELISDLESTQFTQLDH